jgi:hypothetical protein
MESYMLSTVDNPFNPFTRFDEWYAWDVMKGYNTAAFLARVTVSSNDLSEADELAAIDAAIDEIVEENVLGLYIKVTAATVPRVTVQSN